MKLKVLTITGVLCAGLMWSCSWHNVEDDVMPPPPAVVDPCDTMAVSFADTIQIIMNATCSPSGSGQGCHLAGNGARPTIADYASIKDLVEQGRIDARVFNADPSPMPPSGNPVLTACEKKLLQRWIDAGAPNN